jgi:hypothetical protein
MDGSMEDEQQNPHSIKKRGRLFAEVILVLWMTGIFLLNLLMFTPPVVESFAEQLNMKVPLTSLRSSAQQYFLTTDYSKDSVLSSPFWLSITNGQ